MTDFSAAIGRRYDHPSVVADADSMVAYALATNDPNPRYVDTTREGGIVAPPLYVVRLVHPLIFKCVSDRELGIDILRVVHGEEDITWHGPIRPGDVVERHAILELISQKKSGAVMAWRIFLTVDGATRVEVLNTIFARKQFFLEVGETLGTSAPRRAVPEDGWAPLGDPLPVAPDQADRYAAASLDRNPIHLDDATAKKAGLAGVILHGLCTMAFTSRAVVDSALHGDSSRLTRLSVRFSKPVLPGQTLTVHHRAGDGGLHLSVTNDAGDVVASAGWAELG